MSNCQVCNNKINLSLIDMGLMPIANELLKSKKSKSKLYPLQVLLCEDCKLFQLSFRIDPTYFYRLPLSFKLFLFMAKSC